MAAAADTDKNIQLTTYKHTINETRYSRLYYLKSNLL